MERYVASYLSSRVTCSTTVGRRRVLGSEAATDLISVVQTPRLDQILAVEISRGRRSCHIATAMKSCPGSR